MTRLVIQPLELKYLPQDFKITSWESLQPYTDELLARPITSLDEYIRFLEDESELASVASEDYTRRMILTTRFTDNKEYEAALNEYLQNISPQMAEYGDKINRKIAESPFAEQFTEQGFAMAIKGMRTQMDLFRTENIPLHIKDEELGNESGKVRGAMMVTLDGEEMTLSKASDRMFWQDRAKREEAWTVIRERQYQDKDKLDGIMDDLISLRDQVSKNAGFDNYRDYRFKEYRRYDYTPADCFKFHTAIEENVVPMVRDLMRDQEKELGHALRPWDTVVDPKGRPPLKAFDSIDDLVAKSGKAFGAMDPLFHDTLTLMQERDLLDLGSRAHKRPGGYMTDLPVSKVPFIFANATEKVQDLTTLIHEMGHAVHGIQVRDLHLLSYTHIPMEVAELASMSMELISYDQWHHFFPSEEDKRRAQREHLEDIITIFPWIAQIDAFQHALYENPNLSTEERHDVWVGIDKRFSTGMVDWSGLDHFNRMGWQKQGHLYGLPFYYIEYGIAQLGALQVWRNYKQDPKQALEQYKNALALGYTKSMPEIYETAGATFDFSSGMLKDLMAFVKKELDALK